MGAQVPHFSSVSNYVPLPTFYFIFIYFLFLPTLLAACLPPSLPPSLPPFLSPSHPSILSSFLLCDFLSMCLLACLRVRVFSFSLYHENGFSRSRCNPTTTGYTHIHMHTHTQTQTYIYTTHTPNIHTYIHTHTHIQTLFSHSYAHHPFSLLTQCYILILSSSFLVGQSVAYTSSLHNHHFSIFHLSLFIVFQILTCPVFHFQYVDIFLSMIITYVRVLLCSILFYSILICSVSFLQLLLRRSGHYFNTSAELEVVRQIKEKCCVVSFNPTGKHVLTNVRMYVIICG